MKENSKKEWWFPLYEFGVHIFIGSIIFIFIALPAIGLNIWIKNLNGTVDLIIVNALTGVEYLLFFLDIALYIIHLFRSFLKSSKAIWAQ